MSQLGDPECHLGLSPRTLTQPLTPQVWRTSILPAPQWEPGLPKRGQ